MSVQDLASQLSSICRSGQRLISVSALQDLLLDIRAELRTPDVAVVVDRHLATTVRRSWFTADEVRPLFNDLSALLTVRPAASQARQVWSTSTSG